MAELKIIISGIELTPEEFRGMGIKITAPGVPVVYTDYKKWLKSVRKALKSGLLDKELDPAQVQAGALDLSWRLAMYYKRLYNERKKGGRKPDPATLWLKEQFNNGCDIRVGQEIYNKFVEMKSYIDPEDARREYLRAKREWLTKKGE